MAERSTQLVPAVTAAQMREVDRIMVDDLGISLLQMMSLERIGQLLRRSRWRQGQSGRRVVLPKPKPRRGKGQGPGCVLAWRQGGADLGIDQPGWSIGQPARGSRLMVLGHGVVSQ